MRLRKQRHVRGWAEEEAEAGRLRSALSIPETQRRISILSVI